jgi:hypothetical protein
MQNYLRRDVGPVGDQSWIVRMIYANWFYLAIWSTIGALVGWALLEPWIDDATIQRREFNLGALLLFPVDAALVGLFLGAAEGVMCRNYRRAIICGAVGAGIGFVGGAVLHIPTELIFGVTAGFGERLAATSFGLGFLVLMMGRAMAWSLTAIPAGMGQGIALREKKVTLNGVVGAILGGLIGGLLFDPISLVLTSDDGQAQWSRAVGLGAIGCFVGLFVGLVEGWTKTAWMIMQKGPLAGKQFILYKDTTILGSSPKADIYLFKDDAIEPRHALVINRAGRFEIEDCGTPDGTYVNGIPTTRARLSDGDQIVLGKTVLEFSMREANTRK